MKSADRNVSSNPWSILKTIAMVVLGVVAGLLILEGAYRGYRYVKYGMVDYMNPDAVGYFVPDPTYGYAPAKNFNSATVPEQIRNSVYGRGYSMDTQFTTNSRGYRGREFTVAKPPGTFRIVTFGGSTTMAMEVNDDETWSAVLEAKLNHDPAFLRQHGAQRVEVINAAVNGWRSLENLLRLETDVKFLQPDLLLVASSWNDAIGGTAGENTSAVVVKNFDPWWGHVKIAQNFRIRYLGAVKRRQATMDEYRARLRRDEQWVKTYEGNFMKMQAIASKMAARVILVSLPGLCRTTAPIEERTMVIDEPWTFMTAETYPFWAELQAFDGSLMQDFGRKTNTQVIDVHDRFEAFGGADRLGMYADNVHLNARGHQEAAEFIRQAMETVPGSVATK